MEREETYHVTNIKMIKNNQIFRHRFYFPIESSFKRESGYMFSQRATCSETDSLYLLIRWQHRCLSNINLIDIICLIARSPCRTSDYKNLSISAQ